ncbi:MAG: lytic murein transglycosylase [Methylobacteriaceae bacterium]|nr:lytic murein transglycosylase [Methylobacteriaceae bacterium]
MNALRRTICTIGIAVRIAAQLRRARYTARLFVAALLLAAGTVSAAADFEHFVQSLWPQAHARRVSRATFDAAFRGVTPDPDVIARTKKQAEFVKPIGDYLATAVSAKRIETGRTKAREWKEILEKVDHIYGVDPYIVLGVWGLETNFGGYVGDKYVIRALATLAYARYRGDYFKKELLSALQILEAGHVHAKDMQGSWAGAMGQTQFMPSSFNHYAVDFDRDGHKDIWTNVPDALASTANYLKKHGWIAGETWGYEVMLPASLQASGGSSHYRSFAHWAAQGVSRADGEAMPRDGEAALLQPAGAEGPAFLVTRNFKVIKSYNNSTSYALGVSLLGDRIAGWPALKAGWPAASR